jgi:hypothetical protein
MPDKASRNLKTLVSRKIELMIAREELSQSITRGKEFFYAHSQKASLAPSEGKLLAEGAGRFSELISEVESIDEEIRRINIVMVSIAETIGGLSFKFELPQRFNDAGDKLESAEVILNSDGSNGAISAEEIWTVMLLKEMFNVNNVEIIKD